MVCFKKYELYLNCAFKNMYLDDFTYIELLENFVVGFYFIFKFLFLDIRLKSYMSYTSFK